MVKVFFNFLLVFVLSVFGMSAFLLYYCPVIPGEMKEKCNIAELIKSIRLPAYPREVICVEISDTNLEILGRIARTSSSFTNELTEQRSSYE